MFLRITETRLKLPASPFLLSNMADTGIRKALILNGNRMERLRNKGQDINFFRTVF